MPAAVQPRPPTLSTDAVRVRPSEASAPERCDRPGTFAAAASYNQSAESNLEFAPFGRPERGWIVYRLQLDRTLETACDPGDPGFAAAVAVFQTQNGLAPSGALTAETFQSMKTVWQTSRPFFRLRLQGVCPVGAGAADLVALEPDETLGGKSISLDRRAVAALRAMRAAARRDLSDPRPDLLAPFSGYRSPASDAERCRREGDCQGVVRAECSAHRTGMAVDLNVGEAPGYSADSTADPNRLAQTGSPAYRWLVRNAERFGFVNYVFEPWHWEWVSPTPTP